MIRHITHKTNYESIISDKYLKASTRVTNGYVSFEKDWKSDILIGLLVYQKRFEYNDIVNDNLVSLEIDENELLQNNYIIINAEIKKLAGLPRKTENNIFKSTFLQNGILSENDYKSIGDYVHVKGSIPIKFIKNITIHDLKNQNTKKALQKLGISK